MQKQSCSTIGCNSTQICKGCGQRMCKAHCLKAGGCADPAHKVLQTTMAPYMVAVPPPPLPIFSVHTTPTVAPLLISASVIKPNPPESQSQGPPNIVASSSCIPRETCLEPAFGSHMTELYTAQIVDISVNTHFNIFHFNLGHWTVVKLNHVVELKDAPCIFIKATHIQCCQDFEVFLSTMSLSAASPNIHTNLAWERAYVKTKYELSQLSKLPFVKNKHSLSPSSVVSTP